MAASAKRRRGWRKRLGALARFTGALVIVGGLYSVFSPGLYAQDSAENTIDSEAVKGQELYDTSCISCHGDSGEGIEGRGPSLIGVGSAAVEFQVNTGRMPMAAQGAQAPDSEYPVFTEEEAEWLGAYIEYLGGGAAVPDDLEILVENADVGEGGELYRVNCSSCHGFSGGGGALSSGAHAPSLAGVSDEELYQAMLTGPQNMPVFGDNELTPEQKADIIAYVQYIVNDDRDPGGVFTLGRFGPATEGLAIFLVGMTALLLTTLWIAGKS